jgi:hypothetical protein
MPDDHSEVVPLLPIPNRTVKRFCANDSADSRVKVGHRQAITAQKRPLKRGGVFICGKSFCCRGYYLLSGKETGSSSLERARGRCPVGGPA